MAAMNRSSRLSNVLFTFLGAASVGLVVAVLAVAGVFESTERVVREVPQESATPVSQPREGLGSVSDIYARTAPGVAFIRAEGAGGSGGTGSGFLIDGQGHAVTTGIISALDREITAPNNFPISGVLQTDAAINPGNSGGPLLDGQGRVIGVNSQIAASQSAQSSGVGFAVPVDTVKEVAPQLIKGGEIDRAYLGVSTGPDQTEDGAVVMDIAANGPAADSDLRPGDRIVELEGRAIDEPADLSDAVLDHK